MVALRARVAKLEGERERIKEINAWFRKAAKKAGVKAYDSELHEKPQPGGKGKGFGCFRGRNDGRGAGIDRGRTRDLMSALDHSGQLGFPGYHLQNLGGNINRNKKRLARLERERGTQ